MSGIIWSYFLDKLAIVPDARELEIVSPFIPKKVVVSPTMWSEVLKAL